MRTTCLTLLLLVGLQPVATAKAPVPELPADRWDARAAAHLLRRAGFGPRPGEAKALAELTLARAIERLLARPAEDPLPLELEPAEGDDAAIDRYIEQRIDAHLPQAGHEINQMRQANPERFKGATFEQLVAAVQRRAEQRALGDASRFFNQRRAYQLASWWLTRMVRGVTPLEDKLLLFWHNHFTTNFEAIGNVSPWLIGQHRTLRRHATGDFGALLRAILRDPAMLRYLDNDRNIKARPNENLARELLELFTLGVGNYSEADVKQTARALTGHRIAGFNYYNDRTQHDYGEKEILGQRGRWKADDVVRILLEQPTCARFLTRKLAVFFLGRAPSPALHRALARRLRADEYQLAGTLRLLFGSAEFYAEDVVGQRVKSPIELVVGLVRELKLPEEGAAIAISGILPKLGQRLFHPPNVRGWVGGRAWINSSTLLARQNLLHDLITGGQAFERRQDAAQLRQTYFPPTLRARRQPNGWAPEALRAKSLLGELLATPDAASGARLLCDRLLARPLAPERQKQLEALLAETEGINRWQRALLLVSSSPEYQLN